MPKALKPGDRVVIDLEAAQALPPPPCPFCHTVSEDERRALLRNFAEGEWTVGSRYKRATCGYCLNGKYIPEDYIQLIATSAVKQGWIESPYWSVPRAIVKPVPLPLET